MSDPRIAELEAANRGLVRLNEATVARAEAAEAQVEKLVEALEEIASHDTGATAGIAYTASAALSAVKQEGGE